VAGSRRRDAEDRRVDLDPGGDAEDGCQCVRFLDRLGDVDSRSVATDEEDEVDVVVEERPDGVASVGRARLADPADGLGDHRRLESRRPSDVGPHDAAGCQQLDRSVGVLGVAGGGAISEGLEGSTGPIRCPWLGAAVARLVVLPVGAFEADTAAHAGNRVDDEADALHVARLAPTGRKATRNDGFTTGPRQPPGMTGLAVLATGASNTGALTAAGGAVGLGGILLAAIWLHYLYR
jgi:hypothetical protein